MDNGGSSNEEEWTAGAEADLAHLSNADSQKYGFTFTPA